jgi:hypothetical protein
LADVQGAPEFRELEGKVTTHDRPREADIEEANLKLKEGLRNCRDLLANYRAKLEGGEDPAFYPEAAGSSDLQQHA